MLCELGPENLQNTCSSPLEAGRQKFRTELVGQSALPWAAHLWNLFVHSVGDGDKWARHNFINFALQISPLIQHTKAQTWVL